MTKLEKKKIKILKKLLKVENENDLINKIESLNEEEKSLLKQGGKNKSIFSIPWVRNVAAILYFIVILSATIINVLVKL